MTNFEKNKEDLMKVRTGFGVNKVTKKVAQCFDLPCEECIFQETACCDSDKLKWLCSDYEKPILTEDEINLIELLSKIKGENYKYITRMIDGEIVLFVDKPTSYHDVATDYYCYIAKEDESFILIDEGDNETMFSNIQFGDGVYDIENKCFIKGSM